MEMNMSSKLSRAVLLYSSFASLVGNASAQVQFQELHLVPGFSKVHGIVMGLAFVIILPLGALLVRTLKFRGAIWAHVACQLVGWALMLAGLATGIKVGNIVDRLHNNAHTIVGTIVVVLLLFQPFIGFIHHRRFLATAKRGVWTNFHVWYGRLLIILGIINGGLGLKLAGNTMAGNIVYGVLGALVGVLYLVGIGLFESNILKRGPHEKTSSNASNIAMREPHVT